MAHNRQQAVTYYRTSSAANVGADKDSLARQRAAVRGYATANRIEVVEEFYDAAVSGAEQLDKRPEFAKLLNRIAGNGVSLVLIEDPTRFARDLAVQLAGHDRLRDMGVELVPVNDPGHFREDTPTAVLVRQVLGAISQFEKAQLVAKLKGARDRKKIKDGRGKERRCEGRKAVPEATVQEARRLARKSPKTGKRRSLRAVAAELARLGHTVRDTKGDPTGKPYGPESIKRMLVA